MFFKPFFSIYCCFYWLVKSSKVAWVMLFQFTMYLLTNHLGEITSMQLVFKILSILEK